MGSDGSGSQDPRMRMQLKNRKCNPNVVSYIASNRDHQMSLAQPAPKAGYLTNQNEAEGTSMLLNTCGEYISRAAVYHH